MTAEDTAAAQPPRPEPQLGALVRTSRDGTVWEHAVPGEWTSLADRYRIASWDEIDGGAFGDVELLVGIPYRTPRAGEPAHATAQAAAEAVVNPIGAMMAQLAEAAGAGITAAIVEAWRTGHATGYSLAVGNRVQITGVEPAVRFVPVPVPGGGGMRA